MGDELLDVVADEVLLGRVEVAVDVPERRQVKDDRLHLVLGELGIGAEVEHGAPSVNGFESVRTFVIADTCLPCECW